MENQSPTFDSSVAETDPEPSSSKMGQVSNIIWSELLAVPFICAMTWSNIFCALSKVRLKSSRPAWTFAPNCWIHLPTWISAGLILIISVCRPSETLDITTSSTWWTAVSTSGTRASTWDSFFPCFSCSSARPFSGPCSCSKDSSGCFATALSVSLPTMESTISSWPWAPETCSRLSSSMMDTLFITTSISVLREEAIPLPTLDQPRVDSPTSFSALEVIVFP
mmetsp:Transcript_12632/g.30020  ORF Transcript_12632/g.30020 Transcript_12632/m.30020 type:complete len:223 (+) Transcript_12632:2474-3142(+)